MTEQNLIQRMIEIQRKSIPEIVDSIKGKSSELQVIGGKGIVVSQQNGQISVSLGEEALSAIDVSESAARGGSEQYSQASNASQLSSNTEFIDLGED